MFIAIITVAFITICIVCIWKELYITRLILGCIIGIWLAVNCAVSIDMYIGEPEQEYYFSMRSDEYKQSQKEFYRRKIKIFGPVFYMPKYFRDE